MELTFSEYKIISLLDSGANRSILRHTEFDQICKNMGRTVILTKTVDLCSVTGDQINVLSVAMS